jgi:hypothetical protein
MVVQTRGHGGVGGKKHGTGGGESRARGLTAYRHRLLDMGRFKHRG